MKENSIIEIQRKTIRQLEVKKRMEIKKITSRICIQHLEIYNVTKMDISKISSSAKDHYPRDVRHPTKITRNVPDRKFKKPHRHLYEFVHSDTCEIPIRSVDGFAYFKIIIEDASRFSQLIFLKKIRRIWWIL